jgi:SAM-dependent methyltransferase
MAATYDTQGLPFFSVFGRQLVERADVRPGMTVLDVGTGRGAVLWPAAEAVGPEGRVVGIDLSDEMVRRTSDDARARGLQHVDVRPGDAESPDFPAASLDRVLSGLVVFLLPDPLRALASWRQLLKPTGRLGVTIFSGVEDERWAPVNAIIRRYLPGGPSKEDAAKSPAGTPDQLRESLLELGYTSDEVQGPRALVVVDVDGRAARSMGAGPGRGSRRRQGRGARADLRLRQQGRHDPHVERDLLHHRFARLTP